MMALLTIVMLGCVGKDQGPIFPDNPNPPAPTPTPEPSEFPLISTDPAFVTEAMTEDITVILNTAGTAADGFSGHIGLGTWRKRHNIYEGCSFRCLC